MLSLLVCFLPSSFSLPHSPFALHPSSFALPPAIGKRGRGAEPAASPFRLG